MIYRLFNTLLVIASLVLLAYVAYTVWLSIALKEDKQSEITPAAMQPLPPQHRPGYQLPRILNAKLFGAPPKAKPVIVQTVVPKTQLSLQLHGMVGSDDPNLARALISIGGKLPRSFGVGEAITQTDATIHRIEKEQVLLDRGGQLERLTLNRKLLNSAPVQ